jgi:hypothetical protein
MLSPEISRTLKIVTAAAGIAVSLNGLGALKENSSNTGKDFTNGKNTQNIEQQHLIPVPCEHPLPWEPGYKSDTKESGIVIELASVKKPEPTRDPNPAECWTIVTETTTNPSY